MGTPRRRAQTTTRGGGRDQFSPTTTLLLLAAVAFYTHLDITGPVRVPEWLLKTTAAQLEPTVRTRVGERAFAPFYRGCSSRELIDAVGRSRLRDDAPARYEYRPPNPEDANEIDLRRFSFSTELEGCPPMHAFQPDEACDLLGAFGGIFFRGDSIMRQFFQGATAATTSSLALAHDQVNCSGNDLFVNSYDCKSLSMADSSEMPHKCASDPRLRYEVMWAFDDDIAWKKHHADNGYEPSFIEQAKRRQLSLYEQFLETVPPQQRQYSPIFIWSSGIHLGWNVTALEDVHLRPFIEQSQSATPRPLAFVQSYTFNRKRRTHHQSNKHVLDFNSRMRNVLDRLQERDGPKFVHDGRMAQLEFFNMTEGALGYD